MKLVMMAGGTGGHVFPALAVAEQLRAEGVDVLWIGTRRGFEAEAVPRAGFDIAWIDVRGVRGKAWRDLLLAPLAIVRAVWQAAIILRRFQPRLVVGMGGYAAGPGGFAAWLLRRPLLIHEQNAVAGTTNRLLARWARRVLEAYPDTFAPSARVRTVGNPVRENLAALPEPAARGVGQQRPLKLLVLGGSLGALALNQAVPAALARLGERPQVRHQAGRTLAEAEQAYAEAGVEVELCAFIDDMAAAYAEADLVICRAGALTLAEIAAVGLGAILVPLPHAIDDHQTKNAEHLVAAGAAVLLPQARLDAETLAGEIAALLAEPARIAAMATAARRFARPEATATIAAECRAFLEVAA